MFIWGLVHDSLQLLYATFGEIWKRRQYASDIPLLMIVPIEMTGTHMGAKKEMTQGQPTPTGPPSRRCRGSTLSVLTETSGIPWDFL